MRYTTQEKIENWFTYHAPKDNQPGRYEYIREKAKSLALVLLQNCPESRELTTAINKLRECIMWANASIACNSEAELEVEVDLEKTPQEATDAILEAGETYGQIILGRLPEDTPGR
jgi:hypothetical protein